MQAELDSDIYNPEYNARIEYRDPVFPPSCTLMLKVYTVDKVSKNLCCAGYGFLPIFIEVGTTNQPSVSKSEVKVGHDFHLPLCDVLFRGIGNVVYAQSITYKWGQVFIASYCWPNLQDFYYYYYYYCFVIIPFLTSAISVSDEIIAKIYTIDATQDSGMAVQNFRWITKFEAEKADLLTKKDHNNTQE